MSMQRRRARLHKLSIRRLPLRNSLEGVRLVRGLI